MLSVWWCVSCDLSGMLLPVSREAHVRVLIGCFASGRKVRRTNIRDGGFTPDFSDFRLTAVASMLYHCIILSPNSINTMATLTTHAWSRYRGADITVYRYVAWVSTGDNVGLSILLLLSVTLFAYRTDPPFAHVLPRLAYYKTSVRSYCWYTVVWTYRGKYKRHWYWQQVNCHDLKTEKRIWKGGQTVLRSCHQGDTRAIC